MDSHAIAAEEHCKARNREMADRVRHCNLRIELVIDQSYEG